MDSGSHDGCEKQPLSEIFARSHHEVRVLNSWMDQQLCHDGRQKAYPNSNQARNVLLYRPKDIKRKRARTGAANPSSSLEQRIGSSNESVDFCRDVSSSSLSLAIPNVGQFDQLPISCTAEVRTAVQYYTEVYAPYVLQRPRFAGHGTDFSLLQDIIPFTLSDPMLLSSTVALMELIQNKTKGSQETMSRSVIRHATDAVRGLQTKLASRECCAGNAIVLCILNLCSIEFQESGFERLNIHLQALTRIIDMQGDADAFGFDGYLMYNFHAYKSLWTQLRAEKPRKLTLGYPSHPFPTTLCKQISDLPDAFHESILARQFCFPSVDVIHSMHTLITQKPSNEQIPFDGLKTAGAQCVCIIREPGLPAFERIVLMGMMACTIHFDVSKRMYRMFKPFIHVHCQALMDSRERLGVRHPSQRNPMVWTACLLIAETSRDSWASRLGLKVLDSVVKNLSWTERTEICSHFFWNELCSKGLLRKVEKEGRGATQTITYRHQSDSQPTKGQETLGTMLDRSMSFIFERIPAPSNPEYHSRSYAV